MNSASYQSYLLRSELFVQTERSNHVDELLVLANDPASDDRARMFLAYAVAKELDDLGRHDQAFRWFSATSPAFQLWVRRHAQAPMLIQKQHVQSRPDPYLVRIQSRKIYYSPEKLINKLQYRPILTYQEELQTLQKWLEFSIGA